MNIAQDITVKCNSKKIKFIQNFFNKVDNYKLMMLLSIIGLTNNRYINIDKDDGTNEEHTFSIRTIYTRFSAEMDSNIGLISMLENFNMDYNNVVNNIAFETTSKSGKKYQELYNVELFIGYLLGGVDYIYDEVTLFGYDDESVFDGFFESIINESEDLIEHSKALKHEEETNYGKTFT